MTRTCRRHFLAMAFAVGCGAAPPPTRSTSPVPTHARPFVPEVLEQMTLVRPAVLACLSGVDGAVSFAIEIAGDGHVTRANAQAPDPTATVTEVDVRGTDRERCAAQALERVHFAPFTNERFAFTFPFSAR